MKNLKFVMTVVAFSFFLATGCQKDDMIGKDLVSQKTQEVSTASGKRSKQLTQELKTKFEKLRASLPAGFEEKISQNMAQLVKLHPGYRNMVLRNLKVLEPTACDDNTTINQWLSRQLSNWDDYVIYFAVNSDILDIPFLYAAFFENSSSNQYFGINGEYSHTVNKTFKDLKRFWNIQSEDIVVAGMHGSVLRDRNKMIQLYSLYAADKEEAASVADFNIELMDVFPEYRNGNHPIFTFNAYAAESMDIPPIGIIPDKIIIGDGVLDAYKAIGYGDVAPQAVLAHEFGHHIQYQLGVFGEETGPEASRRTELMADAYAAYYLSHARGASMQWKRVRQFLQVFFNIGDCDFDQDSHHGTPTQRLAAAEWGYKLAENAQKQGHILTAQKFTALFEAALPGIL